MTPTTFSEMLNSNNEFHLYILIYKNNKKFVTYCGITNCISRRFKEHIKGKSRTTNRFNKSYTLVEIRYNYIGKLNLAKLYENRMKSYSLTKKLNYSSNWKTRWLG